ncbi:MULTISPECIES: ATP-binding protein [unclassified Streptomyces]|uniref:ATP-binding protein n=1 Tax=unclassified Streptomyces TaxID=2593676 RepID=UPI003D724237
MTRLRTLIPTTSANCPAYSQTLPCAPETARTGRAFVRAVLAAWQLSGHADRAALITSELVGNASKHTSCRLIRLTVRRPSPAWVRVGVVDRAPWVVPELHPAGDDEESGRGLLLIDAIADRWGYDLKGSGRRPWGKEVWAELRVEGGR